MPGLLDHAAADILGTTLHVAADSHLWSLDLSSYLPVWTGQDAALYGAAHVFFFGANRTYSYHVSTDTWTTYAPVLTGPTAPLAASPFGECILILTHESRLLRVEARPLPTGYNWIDHTVVALYLVAMLWISVWFARRKQSASDYFRSGNRTPGWVSGMSLFATLGSGIAVFTATSPALSCPVASRLSPASPFIPSRKSPPHDYLSTAASRSP